MITSNATLSSRGGTTAAFTNGVPDPHSVTITSVQSGTTITATRASGGTEAGTSAAFTVNPGTATKLAFSSQPGGGSKNVAFTTQPVVVLQDAFGNTATTSTATVSMAIKSGTGAAGAILGGTTSVSTASGVATFTNLSIDKSGVNYQLTASASGLTSADSATFIVSGAAKLAFTTQPGTATAGSAIPGPPTVSVQRDDGSTETTSTAAITVAIGTNPRGAEALQDRSLGRGQEHAHPRLGQPARSPRLRRRHLRAHGDPGARRLRPRAAPRHGRRHPRVTLPRREL